MSGRQTTVINEQAERYVIPFGGATIDLLNVVKALLDFLAENAQMLARDDAPDMQCSGSPALERYREERAAMVVLLMSWARALEYSAEAEKQPLQVLYLARDMDTERQEAYMSFLEAKFAEVSMVSRSEFQPVQAQDANVVIVDWSQHEPRQEVYRSPLGELEDWSTPTVFSRSAGLLMAGPWQVIGGVR